MMLVMVSVAAVSKTFRLLRFFLRLFFLNKSPPTQIYTLSLHDALPISPEIVPVVACASAIAGRSAKMPKRRATRSEEHTSELQSPYDLVCRLLLEKKKKKTNKHRHQSQARHTTPAIRL